MKKEIWLAPTVVSVGLIYLAQFDYLTFHALAESCAIIVAYMLFGSAWNTVRFTKNYFLLFVGTGYFWVAGLDILHIIAYPGMNLIVDGSSNLGAQTWLIARFLEAGILLAASIVFFKTNKGYQEFFIIGMIAILGAVLVLSGNFPDVFVDGVGDRKSAV